MNRKRSSPRGRGIQKEKKKLELVDVSKDGTRDPESVASTSGTVDISQIKVVARNEVHGSDSDISVEDVEIEQQQQQSREMAPGTGKNGEKHEQVKANAEVPQVLDHENLLFVTK